jgi:two-component sensor histidine kinase
MKATKDGGMVIHEFVTNALKHGCFSRPGGRLDVEWTVLGGMLRIMWVESGLSGIRPPEKVGFGTRLTDMLPNARVKREYHDTGLRIEYVVPLEFATKEIEEDDPWVTTD